MIQCHAVPRKYILRLGNINQNTDTNALLHNRNYKQKNTDTRTYTNAWNYKKILTQTLTSQQEPQTELALLPKYLRQ